ncbi:hypothetical protein P175DRAFT_0559047 [Aspergillus ochraceoroseus IBT 24754]|uniref:Protein ZIP4 homolog n=1 Tax=Aspergillus ochraceoroseus IBT 24754 TaxID=1392256 RepID=A0A2T5LT80_9EURO|nr:uncharacterized protein P175DRAFT_0559047 [Aspergillus ochraceoroseus IBT 24754]PTU19492.1 hypothetical protein P175DRAFT_0559047 [Aspergillus ochraceoroseus IBT 24754]
MATKHSHIVKEQTEAVLALARDLQSHLHQDDSPALRTPPNHIVEKLQKYLDHLPLFTDHTLLSIRPKLDNEGTKLWNTCVQRMLSVDNLDQRIIVCKAKVLAYAMLEAAAPRTCPGNYRVLELSFRIIKLCLGTATFLWSLLFCNPGGVYILTREIENKLIDVSQKVMESTATRLDMVERSTENTDKLKLASFTTEYYMLRIYLSWSQERPDIANHLYSKIPEITTKEQRRIVADICYRIGSVALSSGQSDIAATWLDRALTVCGLSFHEGSQEVDECWKDERMLTLHAYVRSNLQQTGGSETQLRKALDMLKAEYSDCFPALAIFLEILSREDCASQEYIEMRIQTPSHYDIDFVCRPVLCIEVLKELFDRLKLSDSSAKEQWLERIFISLMWTLASTSRGDLGPDIIRDEVNWLEEGAQNLLSEEASHASLILIWKYVDLAMSKGSISLAEQWCQFVLSQKAFQMDSDTKAKFFRKLILCACENYNPSTAQRVFDKFPEEFKSCPLTLYLLYKLSLAEEDFSRVSVYLELLCKPDVDTTYIWSCIADALRLEKVNLAVQSVQKLVATLDGSGFERLQIWKILQCVISVIRKKLKNEPGNEALLCHIVPLFRTILDAATDHTQSKQTSLDLHWLSRESYGIALDLYKLCSLERVIDLLDISIRLTHLLKNTAAQAHAGISEHYLICYFLKATILISEARTDKIPRRKEHYYKEARESMNQFQSCIDCQKEGIYPAANSQDWTDRHRIILSLAFEVAVFFHEWEDVTRIIEISKPIVDAKLSSIFLDCILRSEAPVSCQAQIVKQMIRTFHSSPSPFLNTSTSNFDENLPRYLRCLFVLSVDAKEYELAESVLDQALIFARDPSSKKSHYPKEEIQWLAVVSFNTAVDFFLSSADGDCRRWAEKAITLADLIGVDHGELGQLLRRNLSNILPS